MRALHAGTSAAASSSGATGGPALAATAPTSSISKPASTSARPSATACSGVPLRAPSNIESTVTLTIPAPIGRARSRVRSGELQLLTRRAYARYAFVDRGYLKHLAPERAGSAASGSVVTPAPVDRSSCRGRPLDLEAAEEEAARIDAGEDSADEATPAAASGREPSRRFRLAGVAGRLGVDH